MFITISLVIFWLLFMVALIGSIKWQHPDSGDAIVLLAFPTFPFLGFVTFAAQAGGCVMPIIACWITLIILIGMITD